MRMVVRIVNFIAVVLVITAATLAVPQLFGVRYKIVLSGSMEPDIHVGSIIVTAPAKLEKLDVGDDITYKVNDNYVTHRIVEINREAKKVTTKGLANDVTDSPVYENQIVGKVLFSVPRVGFAVKNILDFRGVLYLIMIVVLAAYIIAGIAEKKKEKAVEAG